MLSVSPLRSVNNERESQMLGFNMEEDEFEELTGGNLLDSINFDDIFVGISDGDMLPDLEMDHEILASFSGEESVKDENIHPAAESVSVSGPERHETLVKKSSRKQTEKSRKSSSLSKNPPGKKKAKVDWTPELHRRFVQAVEQLGLDKAVPSRILDIMGVDTLTRHNVASHLQKYRSHRKHLLAREAEAASWSQRREMYGAVAVSGGLWKREANSWTAPTMGFPPATPMPHFRPLYVWGHPPQAWPPPHLLQPSPPADPCFWNSYNPCAPTAATPFFPPHVIPTRFPSPPVAGAPPPPMYKVNHGIGVPARQTLSKPPSDIHPSKESIDAAIGDVLAKPWLPLPLGLKPPSIDSVMAELRRQGVSKIPPTSS